MRRYSCDTCGGEFRVVAEPTRWVEADDLTLSCPFCDDPVEPAQDPAGSNRESETSSVRRHLRLLEEKSWEAPEIGDRVHSVDGWLHREVVGFLTGPGRTSARYSAGSHVIYIGQLGETSCPLQQWIEWCRGILIGGGDYHRADES